VIAAAWIPLTLMAALAQGVRSALQKQVTGRLSVSGATYVRFCYGLPFAWLYWLTVVGLAGPSAAGTVGTAVPAVDFLLWCLIGGVAQILATAALVASFRHDNFAVGTSYAKTEVLQATLIAVVLLGEAPAPLASLGIVLSFVGVFCLAAGGHPARLLHANRALPLGLLAGTGFGLSAVCCRAAALALEDGSAIERAALTLAATLTLQTVLMGAYLAWRDPAGLLRVFAAWRPALWVGLFGALASVGWFTAMALQKVGLVRALGQVELLFTFAVSIGWFRERVRPAEVLGATLTVVGLLLLL